MRNAVWHGQRAWAALSRLACHTNLVVVAAGADSDSALDITLDWLVASGTPPSISSVSHSVPLSGAAVVVQLMGAGVGAASAATDA